MRNIAKWFTLEGGIKAGRFIGSNDVRAFRPIPDGYKCAADLIDIHPVTGKQMEKSEWWIFYTPDKR